MDAGREQLSKNVILVNKVGQGSVIQSTDAADNVPVQVSHVSLAHAINYATYLESSPTNLVAAIVRAPRIASVASVAVAH